MVIAFGTCMTMVIAEYGMFLNYLNIFSLISKKTCVHAFIYYTNIV